MSRWGKQQGGWSEKVSFAREVEEVPLQEASSLSQSPAAAAVPQPRGTENADEENNDDISSVNFSEVGDSRATSIEGQLDVEDAVFTAVAVGRVERETALVHTSELSVERLEFWRNANSIRGEFVGNLGFLFGNWGNVPANDHVRDRVLMQLKRQPAQIVCLAEAQELVEATLRSPPSFPLDGCSTQHRKEPGMHILGAAL